MYWSGIVQICASKRSLERSWIHEIIEDAMRVDGYGAHVLHCLLCDVAISTFIRNILNFKSFVASTYGGRVG